MATFLLTRPQGVAASVSGSNTTNVTINSSQATDIQLYSATANVALKWIYTITDTVTGDVVSGEILAVPKNGTTVRYNRTGIVGDDIPHKAEAVIVGPSVALRITNLGTNPISASAATIQVLA